MSQYEKKYEESTSRTPADLDYKKEENSALDRKRLFYAFIILAAVATVCYGGKLYGDFEAKKLDLQHALALASLGQKKKPASNEMPTSQDTNTASETTPSSNNGWIALFTTVISSIFTYLLRLQYEKRRDRKEAVKAEAERMQRLNDVRGHTSN